MTKIILQQIKIKTNLFQKFLRSKTKEYFKKIVLFNIFKTLGQYYYCSAVLCNLISFCIDQYSYFKVAQLN